MFCPKCGKINPDDAEKCTGCDALLHEETAPVPVKKKSKALKFIAVGFLVVAVIVAVVLLTGCGNQPAPKDSLTF